MGAWTFRVMGEPFVLDRDEQHDVVAEIARLRALIRGAPDTTLVRLNQNPAGLVGEYASLLIDATVRGHADVDVLPADVQVRYGRCHWFAVSREVLTAFCQQWAIARAEDARQSSTRTAPPD